MKPTDLPRTLPCRLAAASTLATLLLLVLAGCGSALTVGADPGQQATNADIQLVSGTAQDNGTTGDGGTPSVAAPGPEAPARWVQLSSKQSALGTIVTDVNGRTLYRFDEDKAKPPTTTCSGPCATTWPPVTVNSGGKVFLDGTDGQAVGSVKRPDGTTQVTVGGWPVYRFSGDQNAGDTRGQGVKGTWFAVAPTGAKASTAARGNNGDTSTSGTASQDSTSQDTTSQDASSGGPMVLTTTESSTGTVISDGDGQTVYVSTKDSRSPSRSHCRSSKDCSGFSPVKARQGGRVNVRGVQDSDLGTTASSFGTEQMTLNGYPLYTASDDRNRGDTKADGRGGEWFALGLDGGK